MTDPSVHRAPNVAQQECGWKPGKTDFRDGWKGAGNKADKTIRLRRKEFERPLSRFPLRGQAGAGGFPPRRDTYRASKKRCHDPCSVSPRKRDFKPLR